MTTTKRIAAALLLSLLVATATLAQQREQRQDSLFYASALLDNTFLGMQAGLGFTWGSNHGVGFPLLKLRPSVGLSVGKWASPVVGLRARIALASNAGGVKQVKKSYGWLSADAGIDGLVSFSNLLTPYDENRRLNVIGYFGIGGLQTFGFTNPDWNKTGGYYNTSPASLLQCRLGLMTLWRLNSRWDLNVELSHNLLHDSFDGQVTNQRWDRRSNVFVGLIRRMRNGDDSYEFRYARLDVGKFDEANEQVNLLREQQAALAQQRMDEAVVLNVSSHQMIVLVSFPKGSAAITRMQEVNVYTIVQAAAQLGGRANIHITPLGQQQEELFGRRAQAVRESLVARYGIDEAKIAIEPDASVVEALDKSKDNIIVYINESKK